MADYIKRENAIKAIHDEWDEVCNYDGSGHELANEMESVIDRVPADDVAPVRHGRWINMGEFFQLWECSVCGKHTRHTAPAYCPNCGAKMEV